MSVLYLTIFVSMMLVLFFVAGFLYHHEKASGDPLSDQLLPFKDEYTRAKGKAKEHDHQANRD